MNKNKDIESIMLEVQEIVRQKKDQIESIMKEVKFLKEWTEKMIDYLKDE
jgi:hypothetical protein